LYESGKLVVQGKEAQTYVQLLSPAELTGDDNASRFDAAVQKLGQPTPSAWLGSDESGKGDYFGPLVVCAARVERKQMRLLEELGAADCKTLSDKQILELAPGLKAATAFSTVVLMPRRYNELYAKIGNLNKLLAWAHARAHEDVLEKGLEAQTIIVDQFGPETRVASALMDRARGLKLIQRPKAEDDPAVAVASIIARNEFLYRIRQLGKEFGIALPKGAGGPIMTAGHQFVAKYGADALGQVAKVHFKITDRLVKPVSAA
ncbi:MAG: ribonuclease HIII, partial [Myxococcales bacterium]|nr:ribonuclease HIII [Myxococcales bacterium]